MTRSAATASFRSSTPYPACPLPAGPAGSPRMLGLRWFAGPYAFLHDCAAAHGDMFTVRFAEFGTHVFVSDPRMIQRVFAAPFGAFHAGESNAPLRPLLGSHSLLLLDGAEHRRHRRLMMPPFHGTRVRAFGRVIADCTERATQAWVDGEEAVAQTTLLDISLDVILRAVVGVHDEASRLEIKGLVARLLHGHSMSFAVLRGRGTTDGASEHERRTRRDWNRLEAALQREIDARRAGEGSGEDILSLLVSARFDDGSAMTDAELRDELVTLLIAGHETTAGALAWAVYWIHRTPDVVARVREELDEWSGDPADAITGLTYLDAVCKETLRLEPVVPVVSRRLVEPMVVGDYELPAGVHVTPCIYLTHQRPELYPEPQRFNPERFLERRFGPSEYLPFGGGRRRCIGAAFAHYEMKVVLAAMLSRFDITVTSPPNPERARSGVMIVPADGTRIVPRRR